jgi:hypothetical protein
VQSPIRYVAIATKEGDKFLIRVTRQSPKFIAGIEVDRDGEEVVGADFDVRQRIVEIASIKKLTEMRMNVVYGRIERAK